MTVTCMKSASVGEEGSTVMNAALPASSPLLSWLAEPPDARPRLSATTTIAHVEEDPTAKNHLIKVYPRLVLREASIAHEASGGQS